MPPYNAAVRLAMHMQH